HKAVLFFFLFSEKPAYFRISGKTFFKQFRTFIMIVYCTSMHPVNKIYQNCCPLITHSQPQIFRKEPANC
uniref:Uncharacterized protein n=1 Tax=Amphiprion percula TaxID=161767 RepID=A0A3P8RW31_AMPPE